MPQDKSTLTHFPWINKGQQGCKPCKLKAIPENDECFKQMERAFNFADNQILERYGFSHAALGSFIYMYRGCYFVIDVSAEYSSSTCSLQENPVFDHVMKKWMVFRKTRVRFRF